MATSNPKDINDLHYDTPLKSRGGLPAGDTQGIGLFQMGQGGPTVLPPLSLSVPTSCFPGPFLSNAATELTLWHHVFHEIPSDQMAEGMAHKLAGEYEGGSMSMVGWSSNSFISRTTHSNTWLVAHTTQQSSSQHLAQTREGDINHEKQMEGMEGIYHDLCECLR
jgi:hypothetical protein